MQDARQYLTYLNTDENIRPDFEQLELYLIKLSPQIQDPKASQELLIVVAQLYFESLRYQEAAEVLKRVESPRYNEMRACIDFFSAYYATIHDWAARQAEIWKAFSDLELGLTERMALRLEAMMELKNRWDACFPTDFFMLSPPDRATPGKIFLSSSHGIHSLVPLLYLLRHAPLPVRSRWELLLDEPNADLDEGQVKGQVIRNRDILVRITPNTASAVGGKVDLLVWHPVLEQQAARGDGISALIYAKQMINNYLSLSTIVFSVGQIALAEEEPAAGSALPLPSLQAWFQQKHMLLDIPPEEILERRRRSFTRTPAAVSRPRADIVRGETCMPELEEIYFLRDGKGMAAFQRYGVGYWFLTIPRKVCGEDFPSFRKQLEKQVHREEMDKVFFTGWAEGTSNCYIDFLSMDNIPMLHTLDTYFQTLPGGEDIRICSFYWNAPLRTANYIRESDRFHEIYSQAGFNPDLLPPPEDLVSAADRAALEKAFQETQWGPMAVPAQEEQSATPPEQSARDSALALLQETAKYGLSNNAPFNPVAYSRIHSCLLDTLPACDPAEVDEEYCEKLANVLLLADRFREGAKWGTRIAGEKAALIQQYLSDTGSSYPKFFNQWEPRRQAFWEHMAAVESALLQQTNGGGSSNALSQFRLWADCIFPSQELTLLPGPKGKHTLLTGLPDGILTLPAMRYLTSHYPGNLGKRWNIALSGDGDGVPNLVPIGRDSVPAQEVRVSLAQEDGKASLAVYHPKLAEGTPQEARDIAVQLVNCALPTGARLLFVADIQAAGEEPEDAFSLPDLRQQMESAGFQTDISLDALLTRRRYTFTQAPRDTGRPRDDILRGETCMPELYRIYRRLWEEGQIILERYGCNALSLMIPRERCGEDPVPFLRQLQSAIRLAEGDQVFFSGWAEGTAYCYLDLITLNGRSLLQNLNAYACSTPGGKGLKLASFYWNCTVYPWRTEDAHDMLTPGDFDRVMPHVRTHMAPDVPAPDAEAAAALEASFHPAFTLADLCAPKPAAGPAAQAPSGGKKKLSKAQRKAQNAKASGKNNSKKKR